jgi:putative serine/threonine protein kinase
MLCINKGFKLLIYLIYYMINEKRFEKIKKFLKNYPFFEFLAKGKRGEIYKISDDLIVKIERDDSFSKNSIKNEYFMLKKLEKYDYFPKTILYNNSLKLLIREYVKGNTIDKSLNKKLFIKSLMLSRILDLEKLNQQELTNPYKHIFFYKNKVMMIDFERAKISNNPKNVTQFSQYFCKRFNIDYKKIIPIMKKYKRNSSELNFKSIIKVLKELM